MDVRVYILGPAALTTSSQALSVFLAVWRRGGGPRYIGSVRLELSGPILLSVEDYGGIHLYSVGFLFKDIHSLT